jgi:hypothetical protein
MFIGPVRKSSAYEVSHSTVTRPPVSLRRGYRSARNPVPTHQPYRGQKDQGSSAVFFGTFWLVFGGCEVDPLRRIGVK